LERESVVRAMTKVLLDQGIEDSASTLTILVGYHNQVRALLLAHLVLVRNGILREVIDLADNLG
jgi:hypothetical protein